MLREGEPRFREDDHSSSDSSSVIDALLDRVLLPMGLGDDGLGPNSRCPPASSHDVLERAGCLPPLVLPALFPGPLAVLFPGTLAAATALPLPEDGFTKYEL